MVAFQGKLIGNYSTQLYDLTTYLTYTPALLRRVDN